MIDSHPSQSADVPASTQVNDGVTLDMTDGFEAAVGAMVLTYRRKRSDYAKDTEAWSNFEDMGRFAGVEPWVAALMLCQQKLSRISALRANGRSPVNEGILDSLLDNANYAAIALAIAAEE